MNISSEEESCNSFFFVNEIERKFLFYNLCPFILCVKKESIIISILLWNSQKFQHGIRASSGSLKVSKKLKEEEDLLAFTQGLTKDLSPGISQKKKSCFV